MCGIAGIYDLTAGRPVDEGLLRVMLAAIRHRGPDQFGMYLDDQVGLGSARLSIIDLGGGQQPIANEDESLWIVFNGEIFNYVELKPYLEARGHVFATNTDTEVVLHLYEEYGAACLERLNGQWALAIWDAREQTLLLARDRLGVRPLFYTRAGAALVFGSEIKSLLCHPDVHAQIDAAALDQVFTYWSVLSPGTIFRDIAEVPPGHYLLARGGALRVERYWEPRFPPAGESPDRSLEDCLEEFGALLVDATRIRLRADVPVGAYLSGGLDSSTIAAIIRAYTNSQLDTFSIAFSDPDFDESAYQRRMAALLGTEHQVVYATHADIGRVFPEVIWHTETPLLRTSPAPLYLLSQLVHDRRYKVVLTGEGADEFLAGYDIFKEAKVRRFWARQPESRLRPLLFRRLYPWIAGMASGGGYLAAFFGEGLADVSAPDYSHAVRWRTTGRARRFFSDDLRRAIELRQAGAPPPLAYPPGFSRWDPLHQAQYLEITTFLSPYLLSSQGDRVAMAHSVEGRFPFLDYRLVEFCNNLPPRLKLRGLTEKYLLKQLARRWLPDEIWRRPKQPFRAPIHRSFFNDATPAYVHELLSPEHVRAAGLFRPAAVTQLKQKIERGTRLSETDDMALVGILSTHLLAHLFVAHFRAPQPLGGDDDVKICRGRRAQTGGSDALR